MADIVRKHIIFHGSVQGVGFRYYSEHKANQLRLTGWVKNLYNGDVEMEVQGSEAAILSLRMRNVRLIHSIRIVMIHFRRSIPIFILQSSISWQP